ncbi:replication initiation factor domain-containing protein [Lactococcus lactis]|jgi:phage replication initiation protein|uniref:Replication initiation factor domain-containing protein n=1 Tax=Lactococcus lactis TaxID=1358 RepID=A0AB35KBX1_9LACT|nr:replication initiation factor domain-containing protein [Lactococcus lactis]KST96268.1 Transcriptional regulator Cro/CI family [Lactococcus lactis subsp. lactis]MDG4979078.1 replication initiation factor domain-containing protein [Lactococcus lactis]MDG5048971.1 replication initiation factor domain-containing protein [Lactococcus lactis]WKG34826.1 replication initiation factor domain-containing protein [Lactococcus lactis subsp. lactis]WNN68468.1 replication initiation factor domain-contain
MELAKVRKSFGLSQNDIVKITGLSKSMVSMIDKGERQLNSESEQLLVDYLHRKPKADITAMIDYLVIRVKTLNYKKIINEVLKIPDYYFEQGQSGGNGYPFRVEYGEIKVFYHNENIDMGARIEFKGGACRLFETFLEEQNRTWQDFLKDVINYSFEATRINGVDDPIEARKFLKFKRLDIALDERFNEKGNYKLMDLWEKVRKGQIEMKLKGFRPEEEFKMSDGFLKSLGISLYFGSIQGFIRFNFYEKDLEQAFRRNIPVEDVQEIFGFKNRYEIRLKDDKAFQVIEDFVGWGKTPETLYDLGVGIIMDYLQVFDETGRPDSSWYEVFGQGKKYKFITQPKIESLEKRRAWFDRQLKRNLYIEARISRETGRSYVEELISEYDPDDEDEKIIRRDVERIKNRDFEHEARSTPEGQAFLKALGK